MIKYYRIKKGYSQEQIARLLGITLRHYQRIEQYRHFPNVLTALKLAKILGVDPFNLWNIE